MADKFDEIVRRYFSVLLHCAPESLDAEAPISTYINDPEVLEELIAGMAQELDIAPDSIIDNIIPERPREDVSPVTWKSLNWLGAFLPAARRARNRRTEPAGDFTLTTLAASLREGRHIDFGLRQPDFSPTNSIFESLFLPVIMLIAGLIVMRSLLPKPGGCCSRKCQTAATDQLSPGLMTPSLVAIITAGLIISWLCWRIIPGLVAIIRDRKRGR